MNLGVQIRNRNNRSFTLIELLVTLAIVAVLSVVVVMTLNPAELLKQARDSNRLSDLATINTALNLFSTDVIGGFMGTSTVVYVSLPSTTSTCSNLGLPSLPTGYTYNCVTTQNLRNTDGTGWIPVNFQRISSNSPVSQLPIDPINTTSTGNYYTYVSGGSWQLTNRLESQKYQATAYTSGGADPSLNTVGNNLTLAPFVGGLVGWWNFDNDSNGTSTDSSGWRRDATWSTSTPLIIRGKFGNSLDINGSQQYVSAGNMLALTETRTISAWFLTRALDAQRGIISIGNTPLDTGPQTIIAQKTNSTTVYHRYQGYFDGKILPAINIWHHIVYIWDNKTNTASTYLDGVKDISGTTANNGGNRNYIFLGSGYNGSLNGQLDDIRIYNRALNENEIISLYNVGI